MAGTVVVPELPAGMHRIAIDWYESLKTSGQSQFFEPSDWAAAVYVCEAMSRNLNQGARFSSQLFGTVWAAMGELLTTEGARRKARLEVERAAQEAPKAPGVTAIDEYKARLAK